VLGTSDVLLIRGGDRVKNPPDEKGPRNGAVRDRSEVRTSGNWTKRDTDTGKQDRTPSKGVRREILFPTEPSTIGNSKIDRALERVAARKK
jgi:hypothetical protein